MNFAEVEFLKRAVIDVAAQRGDDFLLAVREAAFAERAPTRSLTGIESLDRLAVDNVVQIKTFGNIESQISSGQNIVYHPDIDTSKISPLQSGSGYVTESGDIVTAHHVVAPGLKFQVTRLDGMVTPASVINTDPAADLALLRPLKTFDRHTTGLVEAVPESIAPGDQIVAFGFSGTAPNSFGANFGRIDSLSSRINLDTRKFYGFPVHNPSEATTLSGTIFPGFSGGPILTMNGHVVSMVSAATQSPSKYGGLTSYYGPSTRKLMEITNLNL